MLHAASPKGRTVLLSVSTTADHATDLGFLLHKHPGRVQAFEQSFGVAHVFHPRRRTRCSRSSPSPSTRVSEPAGRAERRIAGLICKRSYSKRVYI